MDAKDSLKAALQGSHTVFLVTNYWETANADTERTQVKNVTDVAKEVGVQHLIFSSLLNVTEATNGRLTHVPHFDSKADVEQYIRDSGVPATFYLPGYYMSNLKMSIQKGQDGSLTWALPVGKDTKFPLIDIKSDTGMPSSPSTDEHIADSIKANSSRPSSTSATLSSVRASLAQQATTPPLKSSTNCRR